MSESSSSGGSSIIGTLASLLIGYLVGNWLAPDIFSMTVSETEWSNIWVYIYMIFWGFAIIIHFIKWIFWVVVAMFAIFGGIWLFNNK